MSTPSQTLRDITTGSRNARVSSEGEAEGFDNTAERRNDKLVSRSMVNHVSRAGESESIDDLTEHDIHQGGALKWGRSTLGAIGVIDGYIVTCIAVCSVSSYGCFFPCAKHLATFIGRGNSNKGSGKKRW